MRKYGAIFTPRKSLRDKLKQADSPVHHSKKPERSDKDKSRRFTSSIVENSPKFTSDVVRSFENPLVGSALFQRKTIIDHVRSSWRRTSEGSFRWKQRKLGNVGEMIRERSPSRSLSAGILKNSRGALSLDYIHAVTFDESTSVTRPR